MNYVMPSSKTLFLKGKCILFLFYYSRYFVLSLLFYVMIFVVIVFKPPSPPNFLSIYKGFILGLILAPRGVEIKELDQYLFC